MKNSITEPEKYSTLTPRKKGENEEKSLHEERFLKEDDQNNTKSDQKEANQKSARIKKNKKTIVLWTISLFILIISIAGALYMHDRTFEKEETPENKESKKEVTTYSDDNTITGREVKDKLASWKESDNFAIVIGTKQLLLDQCSYDINYLKYLTDERTIAYSAEIDGKTKSLKCINYGNCFESPMLFRDGNDFRFYGKILDKSIVYQGHDKNGNDALIIKINKTNAWDSEKSISIKDNELFYQYDIYDDDENVAGVIYITTGRSDEK